MTSIAGLVSERRDLPRIQIASQWYFRAAGYFATNHTSFWDRGPGATGNRRKISPIQVALSATAGLLSTNHNYAYSYEQ